MSEKSSESCKEPVETFARCCGFFRPVQCFNKGAKAQYHQRKTYKTAPKTTECMGSE